MNANIPFLKSSSLVHASLVHASALRACISMSYTHMGIPTYTHSMWSVPKGGIF